MIVIYDKECPFCSDYVRFMRIQENAGEKIDLVNARSAVPEAELARSRYNLDEGMLVIDGENEYFGDDALHFLALLEKGDTIRSRINRLFGSRRVAKRVYPVMKFGRRITLKLLGRKPIHEQSGSK